MHINKANKSRQRRRRRTRITQRWASFNGIVAFFFPSPLPATSVFLQLKVCERYKVCVLLHCPKNLKYISVSRSLHKNASRFQQIWERESLFKCDTSALKNGFCHLSQQFWLGISSVWQYQTHNIQFLVSHNGFSLYHISVLFSPNKQWELFWKLSICGFRVMTSHQGLMKIVLFFFFSCIHPHRVNVPLTASPSRFISFFFFCLRARWRWLGQTHFPHWVRNKLIFFMDSKHWLDIYDQGQPFWFQPTPALRHTEQNRHTCSRTHAETCMHAKYCPFFPI